MKHMFCMRIAAGALATVLMSGCIYAAETETETELDVLAVAEETEDIRPRTIVTTDGEVDDMDSMIHMLLYADVIDIDGLVYSSSVWHWSGDGEHTLGEIESSSLGSEYGFDKKTEFRPQRIGWIEDMIRDGYGEAWPNLSIHDQAYPTPGELVGTVKVGNVEFEGDTRNETAGSELIKSCILDDDPRILYLQAWGGCNTIARALMSIEEKYKATALWDDLVQKINQKVVIISCGDQDNTYQDYISLNWPDITKLNCSNGYGYDTIQSLPSETAAMFRAEWMMKNIKFRHGSLLEKYYLYGDGQYIDGEEEFLQYGIIRDMEHPENNRGPQERYSFISEGDSPCFMYLIPVGLRGIENRSYGSWGGRPYLNGEDIKEVWNGSESNGNSLYRWVADYQNDWAARADWCVTESYDGANHAPQVKAEMPDMTASPGESVTVQAEATDPDGDALTYEWVDYQEAGTYSGENNCLTGDAASAKTSVTVPKDAKAGDTFNLVCRVTDEGTPALTRYAQVIITAG